MSDQESEDQNISRQFIHASLRYIKAINTEFGTNKAHELWSQTENLLGADVKMAIFGALLSGERVGITMRDIGSYKINVIKTIRQYTGMGLVASKDEAEGGEMHGYPYDMDIEHVHPDMVEIYREALITAGATVD